jgi:hypothetical protein
MPKFYFVSDKKPSMLRQVIGWISTIIDVIVIVAAYYLNHRYLADNGWVSFLLFLLAIYTMWALMVLGSNLGEWKTESEAYAMLETKRRRAEANSLN